jgi:hypothetical protein
MSKAVADYWSAAVKAFAAELVAIQGPDAEPLALEQAEHLAEPWLLSGVLTDTQAVLEGRFRRTRALADGCSYARGVYADQRGAWAPARGDGAEVGNPSGLGYPYYCRSPGLFRFQVL